VRAARGAQPAHRTAAETQARRASYRVQDLVLRRLDDQLSALSPADYERPVAELYQRVLEGLRQT
jgi:hypothetical protein